MIKHRESTGFNTDKNSNIAISETVSSNFLFRLVEIGALA